MDERTAVVVRRTTETDVPAVVALTVKVAAEGRWLGVESGFDEAQRAAEIRAQIDVPSSAAFVAEVAATGTIVGSLGIHLPPYGVAELFMMVDEVWRRTGIGSALLRRSLDWAAEAGAHKVALQCWPHNDAALALYERFGFEREGYLFRHYPWRDGELWDAVILGKLMVEGDRRAEPEAS